MGVPWWVGEELLEDIIAMFFLKKQEDSGDPPKKECDDNRDGDRALGRKMNVTFNQFGIRSIQFSMCVSEEARKAEASQSTFHVIHGAQILMTTARAG